MDREPLGFSPELRTPPLPTTHVQVGTSLEHWPETTLPTSHRQSSFCESTRNVRPRVAPLYRCSWGYLIANICPAYEGMRSIGGTGLPIASGCIKGARVWLEQYSSSVAVVGLAWRAARHWQELATELLGQPDVLVLSPSVPARKD
jgi:hypothetical protein